MEITELCWNPRTGELSASIVGYGHELRRLCVQVDTSLVTSICQVDFPLCADTAELLLEHKFITQEQADALMTAPLEDRCEV